MSGRTVQVLAVGPLALVEDLGRPGLAATGVGRSGAADRAALRLANRLVANPEGAAGIEVTFGGLALRAGARLTVALAGAPAPADVDGTPVGHHALVDLRPGQVLRLGVPPTGLRSYLAVRGGVHVAPVLGSRSTDTLSRLGPAPLRAGDRVPIGPPGPDQPVVDVAAVAAPSPAPVLRVLPGRRCDWLAPSAWTALTTRDWSVSPASDRVGLRLTGPALDRTRAEELPSEGLVPGAVQVPPDGAPVLFLADHPVTGGYPVLAVVVTAGLGAAAQARPGDVLRFRAV